MRVVVTGRQGQVVCSLVERGTAAGHEIVAIGRPELDLADDQKRIVDVLERSRPDVVVSAAAYTAVDAAEKESDRAFAINRDGAGAVARAAQNLGVPLIHLSTDYVFNGSKSGPYTEDDETDPASVYGKSKLAGEREVLDHHINAAVVRTAWVYSPFATNFAKTMLRLAESRDEVSVVTDQRGNPTSALDIADALLVVASNLLRGGDADQRGLFHMTGTGDASWADFAEDIFEFSNAVGGPTARVKRISTADYPTQAKRPSNSRLDCTRLEQAHGLRLPNWRESAPDIVSRIVANGPQGDHSK